MKKLNSLAQLGEAMMDNPVYRNQRAIEERAKREQEQWVRLQELDEITEGIPLERLREMCEAEREGKSATLPFIAMIEKSLRDGKMHPQSEQKQNGRYAVVYVDRTKWSTPLIDICGAHYNIEQAKARLAEITREAAQEGATPYDDRTP